MKFLVLAFVFVGVATAAVFEIPTNELLPSDEAEQHVSRVETQSNDNFLPSVLEVPQLIAEPQQSLDSAVLADDGYHYKVVRRIKYRHRRDVNELPYNNVNFNPLKQYQIVVEPQDVTAQASNIHQRLAHQPSNQYLPPYQANKDEQIVDLSIKEHLPPLKQYQIVVEPQNIAHYQVSTKHQQLADQPTNEYFTSYQTNTDVQNANLPNKESLPPLKQYQIVVEPQDIAPQVSTVQQSLADQTNTYVQIANLPNKESLPPLKQYQIVVEPQDIAPETSNLIQRPADQSSNQNMPPKQLKIDIRFAELPTTEHLTSLKQQQSIAEPQDFAPHAAAIQNRPTYQHAEDVGFVAQPINFEYQQPVLEAPHTLNEPEKQNTAILAFDGYHYKVGFRHRRDINELPSNEYLPPIKQYQTVVEPQEALPQESAVLANDGYRYKVVRRNKYRQRRV